jgi:DNA mismatch repair protein MutS2
VDFDYESFAPRYTLLEGVAGSSDPVLIAGRMGFPEEVIKTAEEIVMGMKSSSEVALEELNLMRAEAEHAKKLIAEQEAGLKAKYAELEAKSGELEERLAKRELDLLEDTVALLQKGKRLAAERTKATADEISGDLDIVSAKIAKLKSKQKKIEDVKLGDTIYLERYSKTGKILSLDNGSAYIDLEGIKVRISRTDLVGKKITREKKQTVTVPASHAAASRSELLLVGKRVEEALDLLDKYIDDALLTGYDKVYIIHGRGSGQLRRAVQDFLRTCGRIKAYEAASATEGGNAVTIVNL